MSILVIGLNGRPLMPTTTRKARILLKANKASVICRNPFTIHLWYKTECATQEGSIGVDTGSQNIGIAVTAGSRQVLKAEHVLRSSMEKRELIEARAAFRRSRRYRNTWPAYVMPAIRRQPAAPEENSINGCLKQRSLPEDSGVPRS